MCRATCLMLFVGLLLSAGCDRPTQISPTVAYYEQDHVASLDREGRQPALLFDRIPGSPPASAFAYRSTWPSTSVGVRAREIRHYVTYVNDYQGHGFYSGDHYHRSARYYETGYAER